MSLGRNIYLQITKKCDISFSLSISEHFSLGKLKPFPPIVLSPYERRLEFMGFSFSWWRIIWGWELGGKSRRKVSTHSERVRIVEGVGMVWAENAASFTWLPPVHSLLFLMDSFRSHAVINSYKHSKCLKIICNM